MCRWKVEDEDVEVVHGHCQPPPVFYQHAFIEAINVTIATFAQASVAGGQGGLSNLQRFRTYHPPTFMGGSDSCHGRVIRNQQNLFPIFLILP